MPSYLSTVHIHGR